MQKIIYYKNGIGKREKILDDTPIEYRNLYTPKPACTKTLSVAIITWRIYLVYKNN